MSEGGWIGVDLDGTLAHFDGWKGVEHIGEPISTMLNRVKKWLEEGKDVRIFTARVHPQGREAALPYIEAWCEKHIGKVLPVTNAKDYYMIELWDDRAKQVIENTGITYESLWLRTMKVVCDE